MFIRTTSAATLALTVISAASPARAQCVGTWQEGLGVPGVSSGYTTCIYAQTPWDPDGAGPLPEVLVISGYMEAANGVTARWIATWDGVKLKQLGDGFDGWCVALKVWNGTLYAAGQFSNSGVTPCKKIARWNGAAWEPVGGGITAGGFEGVEALEVYNNELYAAGVFQQAGGVPVNNIAKFNGTTWSSVNWASAGPGISFTSLQAYNGALYAGGSFTTASSGFDNLARWDGAAWSSTGGTNAIVRALEVHNGLLYVGGDFYDHSTPIDRGNRVAAFNGSSWSRLGSGTSNGMGNQVFSLHSHGGDLYIGGGFDTAGGAPISSLARWNGSSFSPVGFGAGDASVYGMATWNGVLYAGTYLGYVGGRVLNGISWYDGATWQPLGQGFNGAINAWCWHNGELYAAGEFTAAAGTPAARVARRTASGWAPLSTGTSGPVYALTSYAGKLVAGGQFATAGGQSVSNIAAWDGSAWQPLGATPGVDNVVHGLGVHGTDLIVAGSFTNAGGAPAARVARWDGAAWSALGAGFSSQATAVLSSGGNLYVGGTFSLSGTTTVNGVARWDGSAWQPVGAGLGTTRQVLALTEYNGLVLAGGYDLRVAGNVATCVGAWNGTSWSSVGPSVWGGCSATVASLGVYNGDLFAGGAFTCASLGNNILRWNGASWSPMGLGTGTSGGNGAAVRALTVEGDSLLVGGRFSTVDGSIASTMIAKWRCACPADFNGDGFVDGIDYDQFNNAFESGDPSADFNHDGFIDGIDYDQFNNRFEAGC